VAHSDNEHVTGTQAPTEPIDRVCIAIENWAPRFIANGVDPNDVRRITDEVREWSDWCRVWSRAAGEHAALAAEAESSGNRISAGEHYARAAVMYHFGKFMFFQFPAEYAEAHTRTVELYRKGLPYFLFPSERVEIPYEGDVGFPGVLRRPAAGNGPVPVVIILPGLDSVKEEMHWYGNDFLARGMAVLAVDGPGQGEMAFDLPLRQDAEVVISRVLDFLANRSDVDGRRAGVMGVSLGGYAAVRAAAFEPRVRASIALATSYHLYHDFERVPPLTREAFVHKLRVPNEAAAREQLRAWDLAPVAPNVRRPLLIIMGRQDRLFNPSDSEQMARDVGPLAELLLLENGNHVCNNVAYRYRPQQADWMSAHLSRHEPKLEDH